MCYNRSSTRTRYEVGGSAYRPTVSGSVRPGVSPERRLAQASDNESLVDVARAWAFLLPRAKKKEVEHGPSEKREGHRPGR